MQQKKLHNANTITSTNTNTNTNTKTKANTKGQQVTSNNNEFLAFETLGFKGLRLYMSFLTMDVGGKLQRKSKKVQRSKLTRNQKGAINI